MIYQETEEEFVYLGNLIYGTDFITLNQDSKSEFLSISITTTSFDEIEFKSTRNEISTKFLEYVHLLLKE